MHYSPAHRGFSAVALVNPKSPHNIGGAIRAAACYDVALVVLGGHRHERLSSLSTDTVQAWKHIPLVRTRDVFDALPYSCVPVAVDLVPGAEPMPNYAHPERAFYIFGAEDATLGRAITDRCRDVIYVPTNGCMNLAASVNVVLYDRMSKRLARYGGAERNTEGLQAVES